MSLKSLIHSLALRTGLSPRLARGQGAPRILMFHGTGGPDFPAALLRDTLEFLRRHFDVVALQTIVDGLGGAPGRNRHAVALTFDDGLRNNLEVAYPLLREYEVPATFFVCPGLIDAGRWLWNHEARQRLRALAVPERARLAADLGAPDPDVNAVVEWMKRLPLANRQAAELVIRQQTAGYQPSGDERQRFDLMTWEELATLDPALISVGSHTTNHAILTGLAPEALPAEIDESRRQLEARLGRPVTHFCYPNGLHDDRAVERVRGAFTAAVTTEGRVVRATDDPWRLPRIGVAETVPYLAWRLHRPTA
jgi:peptidoglycan/xylan/chitin deacetylase (PgdA/CDA1 family)